MLEYPQVALDFMNRDHADFVVLRKQLLSLLSAQAPDNEMDTRLDELLNHTRHHFAEEERLMQETGFPPYPMHKGEHDSVLTDMTAKVGNWKIARDKVALRDWLDRNVGDWFVDHVSSMDLVTARFIASQQQSK